MKINSKKIGISSNTRIELIDITSKIRDIIKKESYNNGLVNLFVKHTTCGLIINEAEKGLLKDITDHLSKLIPFNAGYMHDRIDSNADAHIKSVLLNPSITIPIENNNLVLGTWQSILFYDLDGPRNRNIYLTFIVE